MVAPDAADAHEARLLERREADAALVCRLTMVDDGRGKVHGGVHRRTEADIPSRRRHRAAHHRQMTGTSALLMAALDPVLAGTAFDRAQGARSGRSAYLLWCTPARTFRERHPNVPEALDPDHPDGCIDLTVEVDDEGRLVRAEIEMMPLAGDLLGQPIEDASRS